MVPMDRTSEFCKWFEDEVALYPVYICPAKVKQTLLLQAAPFSMDWGIGYGVKKYKTPQDKMALKHKMMEKTYSLGGDILKYFAVFKYEEDFWQHYGDVRARYIALKQKNDPLNRFYSISEKLV